MQDELEALRASHNSLQHEAAALQAGGVRLKAEAERAAARMAESQQEGLALNRYLLMRGGHLIAVACSCAFQALPARCEEFRAMKQPTCSSNPGLHVDLLLIC